MLRFFPAIAWALLIFLGSCLPGASVSEIDWLDFTAHKLVHLFEYGVLAILLYRALRVHFFQSDADKNKLVLLVVLACFLHGLSDEWHQSFTPGREAALRDALIDLGGAVIGLWIYLRLKDRLLDLSTVQRLRRRIPFRR